jgi:DNA-binding NarL/FixJ family response regulator
MVVSSGGVLGAWSSALSPREREVALLVARGLANKEIARELGLCEGTVKLHVHSIFLKLRAREFLKPGPLRERYTLMHLIRGSAGQTSSDFPRSANVVASSVLE